MIKNVLQMEKFRSSITALFYYFCKISSFIVCNRLLGGNFIRPHFIRLLLSLLQHNIFRLVYVQSYDSMLESLKLVGKKVRNGRTNQHFLEAVSEWVDDSQLYSYNPPFLFLIVFVMLSYVQSYDSMLESLKLVGKKVRNGRISIFWKPWVSEWMILNCTLIILLFYF